MPSLWAVGFFFEWICSTVCMTNGVTGGQQGHFAESQWSSAVGWLEQCRSNAVAMPGVGSEETNPRGCACCSQLSTALRTFYPREEQHAVFGDIWHHCLPTHSSGAPGSSRDTLPHCPAGAGLLCRRAEDARFNLHSKVVNIRSDPGSVCFIFPVHLGLEAGEQRCISAVHISNQLGNKKWEKKSLRQYN